MWAAIGSGFVGLLFWLIQKKVERSDFEAIQKAEADSVEPIQRIAVSVASVEYEGNDATIKLLSLQPLFNLTVTSSERVEILERSLIDKTIRVRCFQQNVRLQCEPYFLEGIGRSFVVDLAPPEFKSLDLKILEGIDTIYLPAVKRFFSLRGNFPIQSATVLSATSLTPDITRLNYGQLGVTPLFPADAAITAVGLHDANGTVKKVVRFVKHTPKSADDAIADQILLGNSPRFFARFREGVAGNIYVSGFPSTAEIANQHGFWPPNTVTSNLLRVDVYTDTFLKSYGFSGVNDPSIFFGVGLSRRRKGIGLHPQFVREEDTTPVGGFGPRAGTVITRTAATVASAHPFTGNGFPVYSSTYSALSLASALAVYPHRDGYEGEDDEPCVLVVRWQYQTTWNSVVRPVFVVAQFREVADHAIPVLSQHKFISIGLMRSVTTFQTNIFVTEAVHIRMALGEKNVTDYH